MRWLAVIALLPGCALDSDEPPPGGALELDPQPTPGEADPGAAPGTATLLWVCAGSPYRTIQEALDAAPPGGTVRVCPGTYHEGLWIRRGVTLVSTGGAALTHITAHGIGRAITVHDVSDPVAIDGFTIENGESADGGGVSCIRSTLRLTASTLRGNYAATAGGALYAAACSVTIEDLDVIGNRAGDRGGGGFFAGSAGTMRNSHFLDNEAGHGGGGAAIIGPLHVSDSRFQGNRAGTGGGVITWDGAAFEYNTFFGNTAGSGGGGVYTKGLAYFAGNVIAGNHAASSGGGILVIYGDVRMYGDVVSDNTAFDGGGVSVISSAVVLDGVRVEGNHASGDGGGIGVGDSKVVRLVDVSVTDNLAGRRGGGVVTVTSGLVMLDSRLVGNHAAEGGGIFAGVGAQQPLPVILENLDLRANVASEGGAILVEAPLLRVARSTLFDNAGSAQVAARQAPSAPYPAIDWTENNTFPASFLGMADPTGIDGNTSTPPLVP